MKSLGGFDLDDDFVVDDRVEAMMPDDLLLKPDWNSGFALDGVSTSSQDSGESIRIDAFQESKSKRVVDIEETPNDLSRALFFRQPPLFATHILKIL